MSSFGVEDDLDVEEDNEGGQVSEEGSSSPRYTPRSTGLDNKLYYDYQQRDTPSSTLHEITDRKMLNRLLYTNPVCILSTPAGETWKANVMTMSWLTPIDNEGHIVFSMNRSRYSANSVVKNRSHFVLSVPVSGMEETLKQIGKGGKKKDKENKEESKLPSTTESFLFSQKLADLVDGGLELVHVGSKSNLGFEELEEINPYFAVKGTVAHMLVKVERVLEETDNNHYVCRARIRRGWVDPAYWQDGKMFKPSLNILPSTLTFFGSQQFGDTVGQSIEDGGVKPNPLQFT